MTKPGRNEPCPCGSGQKYKRCCLQKQSTPSVFPQGDFSNVDPQWLKIRRTEGELVPTLLAFGARRYGSHSMNEAWEEFTLWVDAPMDGPDFDSGFIPWFLFNWIPDNAERPFGQPDMPESPIALTYLKEHRSKLDAYQRRFIEAICEEPYTFFVILDAVPDQSLTLRDVLLGRELTVRELQGSRQLKRGDLIAGRSLTLDEQSILMGMMPYVIPARYHLGLLDFRDSLAKKAKKVGIPLDRQFLCEYDIEIREVYFDIADELENPQPPILANTDGDPIELTQIYYRLKCTPQTALDRLETLTVEEFREHILEQATYDSAGLLKSVSFDWHKRGNKKHPSWDNTVLGKLSIDGNQLTIEVNSTKRAKMIRSEIKKRLGKEAALENTTTESIEELLAEYKLREDTPAERKRRTENDGFQSQPEVQAMLKEQMKRHWETWLDQPIPVLGNQSPRQCARTPQGRERLEALLLEYENASSRQQQELLRPDIPGLRRQLGLLHPLLENKKS